MRDLPAAAEEDAAHIINGDPGSSRNHHRVVFDDVDSQVEEGVDAQQKQEQPRFQVSAPGLPTIFAYLRQVTK
jgi:hypothetical protein